MSDVENENDIRCCPHCGSSARRLVLADDGNGKPAVTPLEVCRAVAKEFRIAQSRLRSPGRGTRYQALARDELARRLYEVGFTYGEIGEFLGKRTDVGAMLAAQRAEARLMEALSGS